MRARIRLQGVTRLLVVVVLFAIRMTAQGPAGASAEPIPVVFVHGNGDDSAKWIGVIWLWESNGYPKDRLYSIRFTNPSARTDDSKDEAFRSSTTDAAAELSGFVTRVLIETHSRKVALVGSSRGGMTIRNYLEHGGAANVAYAVLCGTPNHGVTATDANLNGEFNGKGPYLRALNHATGGGLEGASEVVDGVKMMTLRSDSLDKYAQPTGIGLGLPTMATGVSYEGPALKGAENVVLPGLDHRELAFHPRAFAEMYRFITGHSPRTLLVIREEHPVVSGLITGFAGFNAASQSVFTNQGAAGVKIRVTPVGSDTASPVYDSVTGPDGRWGPMVAAAGQEYCFDLEFKDSGVTRHVLYYKAPIARSTTLMNLRLLPVPKEASALTSGTYVFVERPQGYFSRDRDPVEIAGAVSKDEPGGLPVRDSFLMSVPPEAVPVRLREEQLLVRGSSNLAIDLPVVDFLW